MDCIKCIVLLFIGAIIAGCGGGGSSDKKEIITPGESPSLIITSDTTVIPEGVIDYGNIKDDIARIYLANNSKSGISVMWERINSSGVMPLTDLLVSDYDESIGLSIPSVVREGVALSEVKIVRDGLGDIFIVINTPGVGITSLSRINNSWFPITEIALKGGCVELDSSIVGSGAVISWCNKGNLHYSNIDSIGRSWINMEALIDEEEQTILGRESDHTLSNMDDRLIVSWSSTEGTDEILSVGEFNRNSGAVIVVHEVERMDAGFTPFNAISANGSARMIVFSDASQSSIDLKASYYDGATWNRSSILKSDASGFSQLETYYLDNGNVDEQC